MLYFLIFIVVIFIAGLVFKSRLNIQKKKKFNENFFVILSGFSAFIIICFVIYLLIHIFMLGKGSISWNFIFSTPAEGLTEGGIFPAIIGTALLVILMSIVGVPLGTITAIYLTEYARENSIISKVIRFAVNTLAGVPAIVFGLFGLGFFIGVIGRNIDKYESIKRIEKMEILFKNSNSPFSDDGKATSVELKELFSKNDKQYWNIQIGLTEILTEMYDSVPIEKKRVLQFFTERSSPKWGQPAL
ncbi:MAG: phosphate transport system permease protein, partial [Bacteroidota bacterium]|nr:phosphate transport system permease protein [Bacteroidota bacterium]